MNGAPGIDEAIPDWAKIRPARHFGWEAESWSCHVWRPTRRGAERWARRRLARMERRQAHYAEPWTDVRSSNSDSAPGQDVAS
jgi:hypothetical protein